MNIDKINSKHLNTQVPQVAEVTKPQAQTLTCENSIETSIYNDKGIQVPFCGIWSKSSQKIENECIQLLEGARNGKYKLFTPTDAKKIVTTLEQETNELERPTIIKEAFAITSDPTIPVAGEKIDMYNAYGEPISRQFIQKLIKLNAGRYQDDRIAIAEFAKYELDNGATEPLGAFFKLPETRLQELIPFLKRITDLNYASTPMKESPYEQYLPAIYDHFRLLVYGIDDLSSPSNKLKKQQIKDNLLEDIVMSKEGFQNETYPDKNARNIVLELIEDMNEYAKTQIMN